MAAAGVFDPDTRIELIEGELIEKMPPTNRRTCRRSAGFSGSWCRGLATARLLSVRAQ